MGNDLILILLKVQSDQYQMFKIEEEPTERRYVDRIAGKKWVRGKTYYYIIWKDMSPEQGTWLPLKKLSNLFRMVRKFETKLRARRRRKLLKRSKKSKANSSQEIKMVEEGDPPELPVFFPPENQMQQGDKVVEKTIKVSRFDCVRGVWVNHSYAEEELRKIEEMRETFAWRHECEQVKIDNIVRVNGQLVVMYERKEKKYKCLLSSFKSYLPKLLIAFMLTQYDPVLHQIKHTIERDQISRFE